MENTNGFKYRVVEEAEDALDSTIEKSNVTVKFSLREVQANIRDHEKMLKEFKGRMLLDGAKMKNIEANHPFILKMPAQDRFTVHMYLESESVLRVLELKIKELEESLAELNSDLEEINKQIGIAIPVASVQEAKPAEEPKQEEQNAKEE